MCIFATIFYLSAMRALEYITNKSQRKIWLRAFHIWQHRSYELAPLSEEVHVCASCGTRYQGNFCPRCGQSAKVGRFSFKKAFMHFLDVWGIGNRSMFRSLRDLMFRPGYMIRDYLRGMQSAYFPPFKMFFLLTAFSLVVEHGLGLTAEEEAKDEVKEAKKEIVEEARKHSKHVEMNNGNITINDVEVENPMYKGGVKTANWMNMLRKKYPAIFALVMLMLVSIPLYYFFRKSPIIPDLRFSEFFVALVYTSNMYSIYSILGTLFNSGLLKLIALLMIFVTLKQFSGFSKKRVLGYISLSVLIFVAFVVIVGGSYVFILYKMSSA